MAEPIVRNISDTARWVAYYRARENERADALFRDPYAERLAGSRGREIAQRLSPGDRNAWAFVTRTYLYDQFLNQQLTDGADTVINLAAGLDARPYRMELPATLRWFEIDLPGILDYKEDVLHVETPRCRLDRIRLDLADTAARKDVFQRIGQAAKHAVILTEGLLIYLTREQVGALAEDLAAQPSFRHWIIDLASPGLLSMMQKQFGQTLVAADAAFKFAPPEGPPFFEPHGWKPVAVQSMLKTAARLKRVGLMFRLLALLPASDGAQGSRPWSAVCLLENTGRV